MLDYHTLDVFTSTPYSGNPLAVVLGADGLTTEQMQIIASEFDLSETIFVQTPDTPAHSAKVRIFTPGGELPFAGHPTIGCAILLAEQAHDGDFDVEITLEEVAGLVPVQVRRKAGQTEAEFVAPLLPETTGGPPPDAATAAAALGLRPEDVGFAAHQPNAWQAGPSFLYIPVSSRSALRRASPAAGFEAMTASANTQMAYLYCPRENGAGYHARMFAPTLGVPEDPATGAASAILAAQLHAAGDLPEGTTSLPLFQGEDMGRPSEIGLSVDVRDGAVAEILIKGTAVRISHGHLSRLPL